MSNETSTAKQNDAATKEQVVAYLLRHPDFLLENPEVVEVLKAPKANLGGNVADLQHYMVGGLQQELQSLRAKYEDIVEFCRDNMSTQTQVHSAILGLIMARDLEQLLQVITVDLTRLFDVDVVRLSMETEGAELYDTAYPETHYSGITFIEAGTANEVMGENGAILLCEDTDKVEIFGLGDIFADCVQLVKSCIIMRLRLKSIHKDVLLAFGVRETGRFSAQQGVELLTFLGHIVELRLDECLSQMDLDTLE